MNNEGGATFFLIVAVAILSVWLTWAYMDVNVYPETWASAVDKCEANNGIRVLAQEGSDYKAICRNGAVFEGFIEGRKK